MKWKALKKPKRLMWIQITVFIFLPTLFLLKMNYEVKALSRINVEILDYIGEVDYFNQVKSGTVDSGLYQKVYSTNWGESLVGWALLHNTTPEPVKLKLVRDSMDYLKGFDLYNLLKVHQSRGHESDEKLSSCLEKLEKYYGNGSSIKTNLRYVLEITFPSIRPTC